MFNNINNIKSSNFLIIVFSFIDEKQKLKLIKYNKSLQENINITLINYIYFKGRYIIYGSNDIGEEYIGNPNIRIFEGKYLNGERNGKEKNIFSIINYYMRVNI